MFKKIVLFSFVIFSQYLFSYTMPTLFIGTYNENNKQLVNNLVIPNLNSSKNDGWGLSKYTEYLLRNNFKQSIATNKFNIIFKKEFDKNYKNITLGADDSADKKIGFLNVNTFQNSATLASGQKLVYITINLIFSEIGEEANRASEHNNFEVRYTNGITVTGVLGIQPTDNEKYKLKEGYKKFYKQALGDLIHNIINDTASKKVNSFSNSDDIYFSLSKLAIGKRSKTLALKVFKNQRVVKEQLLMMLQETLIKEIRKDKKLDDVVLLYPDMLNKKIFKNWKDYLKRINSVFVDASRNNNSSVIVRKLKKSCSNIASRGDIIYVDGYFIETLLSELYDRLVEKKDVNSARYIKSSITSRIVLSLKKKYKIDALSEPSNIIKKKKIVVGQGSFGYSIVNDLMSIQKNKITKTIRVSIEQMAPKLKKLIANIVEKRKKI